MLVHESSEWKKELRNKRNQLRKYNRAVDYIRNFDSTCFKMERALLYSATIIRVLLESQKMSNEVDNFKINVSKNYPIKNIDRMHRWLDDGEYDFEHTVDDVVLAKSICNSIIHSYVFSLFFEEVGNAVGFLVSSDYDRNKVLYSVTLEDWINYLDFVIMDGVSHMFTTFDEKKSEYIYKIKERG